MHLPDGFLNDGTAAGLLGASATAAMAAFRTVRKRFLEEVPVLKMRLATFPGSDGDGASFGRRLSAFGRERVWRMAATGAFIFSAQMVNFPIGGGTSGHLLGGVLAAIIVGPLEALLVMSVLLSTQAVLFGDGGILALGANIFNMGVVGALGGYAFFRFLRKGTVSKRLFLRSAFVAAWVSVVLAAVAASFEIALSGTKPLSVVLPAMTLTHTAIGFVEGMLTAGILSFLLKKNFKLAAFEKDSSL